MTPALRQLAAVQGGVFTRAQALQCGLSPDEAQRAVDLKAWWRVRRGAYVESNRLSGGSSAERQVLGLHAATLQLRPRVVGSHVTAAEVLEIEMWEPNHDWIHVTRSDQSSRREGGVWHHRGQTTASDLMVGDGLTVTTPLRTALDIARLVDFEHGVVVLDSALRRSRAQTAELLTLHERCAVWPGARTAGSAVAFADDRCGSVGESRTRFLFAAVNLPEPQTQVTIRTETGLAVGIVDFLLDGKTIVEFDGRVKYGLDGLAPEAVAQRLWEEKNREDALRGLGYAVVRVVWADLYAKQRVERRVRGALALASTLPPVRGVAVVEPLIRPATPGQLGRFTCLAAPSDVGPLA